jgi:hypothetical protein
MHQQRTLSHAASSAQGISLAERRAVEGAKRQRNAQQQRRGTYLAMGPSGCVCVSLLAYSYHLLRARPLADRRPKIRLIEPGGQDSNRTVSVSRRVLKLALDHLLVLLQRRLLS